jgi:hypothetical protein
MVLVLAPSCSTGGARDQRRDDPALAGVGVADPVLAGAMINTMVLAGSIIALAVVDDATSTSRTSSGVWVDHRR